MAAPASLVQFEASVAFPSRAAAEAALAALRHNCAAADPGSAADLAAVVDALLPPALDALPDGTVALRPVSKEPPSRASALRVRDELTAALAARRTRAGGVCPIRLELHFQACDEIIRQVALGGAPERALLLLRARDQLKLTLEAYRLLHEASVAWGVKKHVAGEEGLEALRASIAGAATRKRELEARALCLRAGIDAAEKRAVERRALDERRRHEELAYLRLQAKHLDGLLKALPRP